MAFDQEPRAGARSCTLLDSRVILSDGQPHLPSLVPVRLAMRRFALLLAFALVALPGASRAQERDLVVSGGWLFAATGIDRVRNPGILVRAGKLLRVGGDLSIASPDAQQIRLAGDETI